jgi:hypothetical protein
MPRKPEPDRDFYSDWELAEMDGTLFVSLTGEGWLRAIAQAKEADRLVTEALERAKQRARRRDGPAR